MSFPCDFYHVIILCPLQLPLHYVIMYTITYTSVKYVTTKMFIGSHICFINTKKPNIHLFHSN